MSEMNTLGFRPEAAEGPIAVEAPPAYFFDNFKAGFALPIEELVADLACWVLVGQLEDIGSEPPITDDGDDAVP